MMPVIVNKEGSRYKDLRTGTIHPTLSKITSTIQDANCCNLQESIAHNLEIPTKQVTVETSSFMLKRYGRGIVPYFANRTLHKYGNYIAYHQVDFRETEFYTDEFCSKTTATPKEYSRMAKLFANIIMKEWRKDHKSEIAEQRYEDSFKSF